MKQRSLRQLPAYLLSGFVTAVMLQIGLHYFNKQSLLSQYQTLNPPAEVQYYQRLSMGSDQLMGYLLLLGVQLHDNQKGEHVNYRHINYDVLSNWLLMLNKMLPRSDYPAFLASRVYAQVKDEEKIRKMIAVVETLFKKNPRLYWRRMTEACVLAKHTLNDLPRALELAKQLSGMSTTIEAPFWARDMELVLLDELNEHESAQLIISSMLQSESIKDPDEVRFLQQRLLKIQQIMSNNRQ